MIKTKTMLNLERGPAFHLEDIITGQSENERHHMIKANLKTGESKIRDVWIENFFQEITVLGSMIEQDFTVVAFVS